MRQPEGKKKQQQKTCILLLLLLCELYSIRHDDTKIMSFVAEMCGVCNYQLKNYGVHAYVQLILIKQWIVIVTQVYSIRNMVSVPAIKME